MSTGNECVMDKTSAKWGGLTSVNENEPEEDMSSLVELGL